MYGILGVGTTVFIVLISQSMLHIKLYPKHITKSRIYSVSLFKQCLIYVIVFLSFSNTGVKVPEMLFNIAGPGCVV